MDKDFDILQAEEQLAIENPAAYSVSNPSPREWSLDSQEVIRSININPIDVLTTKYQREGPEKLNMFETAISGIGSGITSGISSIDDMFNVQQASFTSPNMTQEEAERLMQDVLYTRYKTNQSKTAETAEEIKYKKLYDFSNGVGSAIKYAALGFVTGSPAAIGVIAGAESAAQMEADLVDQYIEEYGTIEGYTKEKRAEDLGIAGAYGVFNGLTESMLGVERLAAGALGRYSTLDALARLARMEGKLTKSGVLNAVRRLAMSGIEEGSEEFIQSLGEDLSKAIAGYAEELGSDESFKKAAVAAMYGSIIGGGMGWGLYRFNRKTLADKIEKWNQDKKAGLNDKQVMEIADNIIDSGKSMMLDEIATRVEIRNQYGQAFDTVKARVKEIIEGTGTTPWADKNKTVDEYADAAARTITIPMILQANKANMPLSEFLDVVKMHVITASDGYTPILQLEPIDNVDDLKAMLAEQNTIIKEQTDAKKLGVAKEGLKEDAQRRKAILQYRIRELEAQNKTTQARTTRKREQADYVTAKDLQPEQTATIDTAQTAAPDQDYVLIAGKHIPVEYEVVDLSTIQPSHIDGEVNPNYTNTELQNRASRGTTQDVADLREKAANITPERLLRATTAAEGAPLVNALGEVIAGNGRAEIVRYAYENPETAEKYRTALQEAGFNIEGMEKPILVRRNTTMTDVEQIAAADISNISETSAFDEASQARRDTQYLKDSATPTDFAGKLPMSDRRGLMQNNGKWNKRRVQQRYESALLSWLCGNDTKLFENLVLDRGISQKVLDTLTTNGNLIYETATKYPEIGLREDIYHALVKMQLATKDNFIETTQQIEIDGRDVMPENMLVFNWLFTDSTTNRLFLENYATKLAQNHEQINTGEDMFGQKVAPLSKKDALMQALKTSDDEHAKLSETRGRTYNPLFDPATGEVKNPELVAAIASYQNQFAPSKQLNQRVFVSMKGAIEGEYLDADRFLGTGDDTRVWLWGNYTLLSEKIDKEHYFDRFERYGPDLTYNGDEVTDRFLEAGFDIVNPSVQRQVKDFAQTVGQTKEKLVEAVKRNVKNEEDNYKTRVRKVLRRFVPKQMDRAKANEILHDLEAIALTPAGRENGLAIRFDEGTKAAEIQNKYRDAEGKLDDNFINLYVALVDEFEREGSMYAVNNNFIGHVNRLDGLKRSLEGVKKLNWKKFSGQTGFLYKGKDAQVELSTMIRDTGLWEHARNNVYMDVEDALKNALNKNQDIQVALSELGKEYSETTALIPQAEEAIAKALDKAKSEYPDADVQAVSAYLNSYMKTPQDAIPGYSPSIIMNMPLSFSSQEDQLIRKALRMDDHGIKLKHGWTLEVTPTLADVIYKIKEARTHEVLLNYVRDQFKDATNADFIYKPRASMYAAEAPENDVLLNASRDLTKQPKKVQEAIIKTIREYGNKYPKLGLLNNLRNPIVTNSKAYDSETGQELLRAFGFPFYDSIETMAKDLRNNTLPDQVKDEYSNLDVEERIWNYMAYAVESAYQKTSEPTIKDLKEGLEAQYRHYADSPYNNSFEPYRNMHNGIVDFLRKGLDKQNNNTKLSDFFGKVQLELAPRNAFTFLSNLVSQLKIFPEIQEELKKDKSLKLTANPPADEIIIKMFRKNGIEGLKYYGRRDKHGIVTWDKTPVTEQLYSLDLTNRLVVTHGMSIDKLNQALDLGGLPVPSIAISRADNPLTDFGPIKLVGTKNIIDPSDPSNKVYDRDIWSKTFPTPDYKNATVKEGKAFRDKYRAAFVKAGDENRLFEIIYYAVDSKRPYRAADEFKGSDGAQLYYIENVLGKKVTIPMKNDRLIRLENMMPFVKPDQQFIEDVLKIDKTIDNYNTLRKALEKPLRDLIARSPVSEAEKQHARIYFFGKNKEGLFNFSTNSVFNLPSAVREYASEPEKLSIDDLALFKELQKYDLMNNSAYTDWADKQIKELLGEPRVKVGNKLLPWTKENITKAMIRGATVGSENISTGIGKVIASGARQFGSIEDIRQAGQALNTKETSDTITDKVGARISDFATQIIKQGYSEYEREPIYDALIKVASMKKPTVEALQNALSSKLQDSTKFDEALLEEGVEIIQEVKRLSRYYFEAKPQRTVGFNEFLGAVVPTDKVYDGSAEKLIQQGLNVIRSDDLQEGIASLALQNEDILFQNRKNLIRGSYDPELQTIVLGKAWNEMTLIHEFHHRFLQTIWSKFKQAQNGDITMPDVWMNDTQELFNMLEVDPNQQGLTTVQQEKFAYMVEAYLTGLGVDNRENIAFQEFLHWVPEKYKSIMDLGYLDENNIIQNPMLDQQSIDFFNRWFGNPMMPSLPSAPDAQRLVNATDEDGEILPSDQKEMNNREKEWGQDSERQNKADAQLYRAIDENLDSDMRAAMDGEKELMKAAVNEQQDDRLLPAQPTLRDKWFKARVPGARERAAQMAREYLAKNPEHARELAFADPETMAVYDAPVDHGMLIRAVMETVEKGSDEWYLLDNNLAMVKSMSGSALSLPGDTSHQAYLDAKREIEEAREIKAAVNYAGTRRGALDKWNSDIRTFIAKRAAQIVATAPDSKERQIALQAFMEEAKTKFSANTTNAILNQLDLTGLRTKNTQAFIAWAEKQIKQAAHARIDTKEQAELMEASIKAQVALRDIDSTELKDGKYARAAQSGKDLQHWQVVKDKIKKAYIGRWGKIGMFFDNLFGSYAPSAMLMSANTLFFANVPSTAVNTATVRLAAKAIGKNLVDSNIQSEEIKRIKQVFNASGVNLAQMDKPTSPTMLHGEKYTSQEQKHWYNFTFEILGREDNVFRVPTFVDALARIATKNAEGSAAKATALFQEYCKLNTNSEEAKIARKQALAVANMAVFTQDGMMASALNHIRSILNTLSRGMLGLNPKGFGLGNILAPFLKTGANITEMGLSSMLALPRTIIYEMKKLQGKAIPDIDKIALRSDWINLAWTSVLLAVLAAINSDDDEWYTEPYESGKSYDPNKPYDSINFRGVWIKLDIFGPIAIPLRAALRMVNRWEKDKLEAVANGLFMGGMDALSDTPLVQQFTDNSLDYMTKQPEAYWEGFGYNQLNKLIPAQAKSASRAISRATDTKLDTGWLGKTLDRKFHRNYGLDGQQLTTNDLINVLTNRLKYNPQ